LLIVKTCSPLTCNAAGIAGEAWSGSGGESNIFRARIATVCAAVLAAAGIAACSSGGTEEGTAQTPASPPASAEPSSETKDGNLVFTLDRVERDWVDPDHSRAPRGTWVRIPLTVRNEGDTAQTFAADDQKLKEPGGQALSPDTDAMNAEFPGHTSVVIQPGSQSLVYLLFDVPFGHMADKIELHESAQSPGVTLDLP
jgi:Domain of unknown function (DUF4352)